MSSYACPECGQSLSDSAQTCLNCGWSRYRPSAATLSMPTDVAVVDTASVVTFPLFPVATHKFILLTVFSFGVYEVYWFYQNWKRIAETSNEAMSPFWRAIFAPLWGFSLFGHIRDLAASEGVVTRWSPTVLATLYLLLHLLYRLPDPWWLICLATVVPMVPVQQAAQRINERKLDVASEDRNHRYSGKNIAVICVGGLMLSLLVLGMFIPE